MQLASATSPVAHPPAGGAEHSGILKNMYYVYALYNKEHNKVYVGQTKDIDERVRMHNDSVFAHSYTSRFSGAWTLIYKEEVENRQEALKREKQLKSFRGREFIKTHIPL